jgi:hypothetical protein
LKRGDRLYFFWSLIQKDKKTKRNFIKKNNLSKLKTFKKNLEKEKEKKIIQKTKKI